MKDYCELSREQFEAALNFARHLQSEQAEGRQIDIHRLSKIIVKRDPEDASRAVFEVELYPLKAA